MPVQSVQVDVLADSLHAGSWSAFAQENANRDSARNIEKLIGFIWFPSENAAFDNVGEVSGKWSVPL